MKNGQINTFLSRVAFVGKPNVGKSTLLNALVGTKIAPVSKKPQTTRRIIRGIITEDSHQLIIFDTPGILKKSAGLNQFMRSQIFNTIDGVDQVVVIVDALDSPENNEEFLSHINSKTIKNKQPLILVINKIDKIKDKSKLLEQINTYNQKIKFDETILLSAKNKDGLGELVHSLKKRALLSEFLFDKEFFTDASEKEIVAELIREKAFILFEDEIPYKLTVKVEEFDESNRDNKIKPLIKILAILYVEKDSQKAIVIGKNAEAVKNLGIMARKDLENLLQCQVMLKLLVKVEAKWTTSDKALKKLGY